MNERRLIWRGLTFYRRTHGAVAAGMAVATAVLVGALVVGDSVRGSLRRMTLERLGRIDHALVADRFFRATLADDLAAQAGFGGRFKSAVGLILLNGSVEHADSGAFARGVSVLGVDERFWGLAGPGGPIQAEGSAETVMLNARMAEELGAQTGDPILIRLRKPDPIPAEAVHGRRTGGIVAMRFNVGRILPDRGLGRFGLTPSQQLPLNVFVPLAALQRRLEAGRAVNTLVVAEKPAAPAGDEDAPDGTAEGALQGLLQTSATLEDFNLRIRPRPERGYLSVESSRIVLRESEGHAVEAAAADLGWRSAPTLTYLANELRVGDREVPYSTVAAMTTDAPAPFGPLALADGEPAPALKENEILLNAWAAERLGARRGDRLRMTYYESGPLGEFLTSEPQEFVLRGVVAMAPPALDPGLTPDYPGVTDAESIRDWDPPFPIDLRMIGEADEAYWKAHRAAPKGFIALETGLRLWTSRFGRLTSVRVAPPEGTDLEEAAARLAELLMSGHLRSEAAGLVFQPVKRQGLAAGRGANDFGLLFLGFSLFIIVAALLLARILFTLGIEQRAREIGLLLAEGFTPGRVRRLLLVEAGTLAVVAGLGGVGLGLGYAALMLAGLKTWWVASVGTTFLWFDARPGSILIGFGAGVVASLLSIIWAVRGLASAEPVRLLAGGAALAPTLSRGADAEARARRERLCGHVAALVGVGAVGVAPWSGAAAQAGLFYGGGAAWLAALLFYLASLLRRPPRSTMRPGARWPVARLGWRNAARHPARSLSTVALIASAMFILVAVAANRQETGREELRPDAGNGGFALMGEAELPVFEDLNLPAGRESLGLTDGTVASLAGTRLFRLRLNPGEEASCLNLYRPEQPRIVGAPRELIERGGFAFQGSLAATAEERANPWRLLEREPHDGAIPAIGDATTVRWMLRSGLGGRLMIQDAAGRSTPLEIVGLLRRSALQGELVISEANFVRLFPERGGYRFFLIETPAEAAPAVRQRLEADLRPFGLDLYPTRERIERYLAVENTYISTFQALGGLGLLLGTLGLAAVMARNVLERRGELALLACVGYRRSALTTLVLAENACLLALGLAIGGAAALVAVAPYLAQNAAAMPWGSIAATTAAVLLAGLGSGAAAAGLLRGPLLEALRAP